ncbi:hypothetical protein [Arthrobacter nitrophenolicus]|uniref:Uncharacterized protein n=1 Tax=Arthrobacter nitrophenolicus TaxID=683150 RepID=A0A4R5XLL9_9MICC|nr:hypothetical protein [Arthrobacter nitrophenolicus]TDL32280.1 hypothetical protein E2R57_19560 [Arthrobacter nitrophenolicus]
MDEAIKGLIFDLSWGKLDHVPGDQVEQLSTWCTKLALLRTHLDRGREQESPLELTHRFYGDRKALGPNTVQVARVLDTDSAISGNIARELRGMSNSSKELGEQLDAVHLVTFQIGQLFFQVGLSTSSDWSKGEMKSLLAAGRRNRTERVRTLRAGEDVAFESGLTQAEVLDVIETCRMVSQVSAHRESRLMKEAMLSVARGRRA